MIQLKNYYAIGLRKMISKTINIQRHGIFMIPLPQNASTGYTNMITSSENIQLISNQYSPSEQKAAGIVGAGGVVNYVFRIDGDGTIQITTGRPWDKSTWTVDQIINFHTINNN